MKWSDEPLYKRNQKTVNQKEFWDGKLGDTAPNPSPLRMWWIVESEKRSKGELNEIDLAQIKAAHNEFKNNWSIIVCKNPKLVQQVVALINNGDKDKLKIFWPELLKLKLG